MFDNADYFIIYYALDNSGQLLKTGDIMGSNDSSNEKYIISVESRKGGVGKTTAALCLAKLLKKKGYAVLFLDLDITGTDAADIREFFYWKDILNIVTITDDKTKKSDPVNLIELFSSYFMSGKNSLKIKHKVNKINLLGSHLYNSDQTKDGVTCIEKPGVLFDELHGYWLLEFIKQIIDEFNDAINPINGKQKPIAVVIDNSPGYMGLSPLIHEWLTDNGPDHNKFLIVSSLDRQDLRACEISVNKLHKLLEDKSEAGFLYKKLSEEEDKSKSLNSNINAENIEKYKKLLMKLATSDKNSPLVKTYLNQEKTEQKKPPFQRYRDDPKLYMATIINKVPEEDDEIEYPYKYQNIMPINVFKSLLSVGDDFINKKRMLSYISSIEKQFYISAYDNQDSVKENSESVQHSLLSHKEKLPEMKVAYFSLLRCSGPDFDKKKAIKMIKNYEDLLEKAIKTVFPKENNISLYIRKNWFLYRKLLSLPKETPLKILMGRYSHEEMYEKTRDYIYLLKNSLKILCSNGLYYSSFFSTLLKFESGYLARKQILLADFPKIIANMPYGYSHTPFEADLDEINKYFKKTLKIQAQILDYPNDVEFIFDFLGLIVRNPKNVNIYRKIGNQVIIERKFSHRDAKKELGEVNYYGEFESVLSDIVNLWKIK